MDQTGQEILLVEDEAINRLLLSEILTARGYRITEAPDGAAAQALLQQSNSSRFATILLDRMMPNMDGMTLLKWIKAQPSLKDIPVIFQTSMSEPDEIQEGISAGALYYLTKPFPHEKVVATMVNAAVKARYHHRTIHRKLEKFIAGIQLTQQWQVRFRTLAEAEHVALLFSQACPNPTDDTVPILELLINAVEHGNLGITFTEKSQLLSDNRYDQEITRRQADSSLAQRYVDATLERTPTHINMRIKDQGDGFDWEPFFTFNPKHAFLPNGRGIIMASSQHRVQYFGCGNEVQLTIQHSPS
ncbi:response regulator [Magnetococcus sp. PR-3]|uniref:response regulator n=1 Tax=Magnetococcus sp. PR-3 TaxID=3120355 RepID=UPI002FCE10C5